MQPEVMLFDEATSALDPELVGEVLSVVRQLASVGMTMVLVTTRIAFARDVADTCVFMRDGFVVEDGTGRQVIEDPQQAATKAFSAISTRRRVIPPRRGQRCMLRSRQ